MIIRVQESGQYRLDDHKPEGQKAIDELNLLDTQLLEAVAKTNKEAITTLIKKMVTHVQAHGEVVPDDELVSSDAILPPKDVDTDELVKLLKQDGLIPDAPSKGPQAATTA